MTTFLPDPALLDRIANDLYLTGFSIQHQGLDPAWCNDLLVLLKQQTLRSAGVGRTDTRRNHPDIRRDQIAWIEPDAAASRQWLDFAAALQQALNRRLFLGLFSFESHFAHYAPGAFYKTHVDAFRGESNRVVSVVAYLNPGWQQSDGGSMVLYQPDQPDTALVEVWPEQGTLAVFLSEEFPHEVKPAHRDRYSIAGWYRVNTSDSNRIDPPR
ncbi:2OG-Fe(II) oxygenase [Limnobacter humi]|uniref:2OG-Fe(II) oxygenase n=1 Tax=Limnobacter humi TaxID=1778671 RepID=A0ABT1WHV2_9BURK|nr:2OG-Fe(II) oxygenase [Limnobacter humi]MCQ8896616.1 2OG-Fe(II) oxygenase [Limnobacter humi]